MNKIHIQLKMFIELRCTLFWYHLLFLFITFVVGLCIAKARNKEKIFFF